MTAQRILRDVEYEESFLSEYYDKYGNHVSKETYMRFINDQNYRFIRESILRSGISIRTVWVRCFRGSIITEKLQFKTEAFHWGTFVASSAEYHPDLESAEKGHTEAVHFWDILHNDVIKERAFEKSEGGTVTFMR